MAARASRIRRRSRFQLDRETAISQYDSLDCDQCSPGLHDCPTSALLRHCSDGAPDLSIAAPAIRFHRQAASWQRRFGADLSGSLQSLLGTVVIAIFVITFIVQAFQIPSESMENTLLVGDYLLVNKLCYGGARAGRSF